MGEDVLERSSGAATCTLPTTEQPVRTAEFDDLFRTALRDIERRSPTRLLLTLEPAPGRAQSVRDLTGRETECCSFFTFELTEHDDRLVLEVSVPPAYADVLDATVERAHSAVSRRRPGRGSPPPATT